MSQEFQGGWNAAEGVYYAKGSYDNEVEYYNEIICYVNGSEHCFAAILQNMGNPNFKLSEVLAEWSEHLPESKNDIYKLGGYNGDVDLQKEALLFNEKMVQFVIDFKETSAKIANKEITDMQEIQQRVNDFIARFQGEFGVLQEALNVFESKYFQEEETEFDFDSREYYTGMQQVEFDESNPLLQPVHGISLEDYAAATANIANGVSDDDVAKALGVEKPQWEEASLIWIKRMEQDTGFTIAGLYGQYFATAGSHPKFATVFSSFETNEENLARLQQDELYYHELLGAMRAAHEYGIDSSQWLRDKHGLSLGAFQSAAVQWANSLNFPNMISGYQEEMYKKYASIFAEKQGGNVADNINF